MKKILICSKKSVRTFKLRIEPYFLSHAERGESLQIQDFLGGIHLCRHFVPTPFRLPIPIFNFGGEDATKFEPTDKKNANSYDKYTTSSGKSVYRLQGRLSGRISEAFNTF